MEVLLHAVQPVVAVTATRGVDRVAAEAPSDSHRQPVELAANQPGVTRVVERLIRPLSSQCPVVPAMTGVQKEAAEVLVRGVSARHDDRVGPSVALP
jgi:hypothetical protein